MANEIVIEKRFCGPPGSGNGGYVAGRLARHLGEAAQVRLHLPPPLDRPLRVQSTDAGVELLDGDQRVATARIASFELQVPPAPDPASARAAAERFQGLADHPFPGCFVCGPARDEGDGLRIFPGRLSEGEERVACTWIPDPSLAADESAVVAEEFVWSALDCPGGMSFAQSGRRPSVLGEFSARIASPVRVAEECVVMGWVIEHSGRKHRTGSALFGADGRCAAVALGTWIELAS